MNSTTKIADSTIFHSSPPLAISSTLTSPPNLLGCAVAGGLTLLGASWPVTAAIGAGAAFLAKCIDTLILGGDSLRPAVFLGAEKMSFFIEGGRHSLIIPPVLECVKKMNTPNAKKLESCLENMQFFEQHFDYSGLTNQSLMADCKKKINCLKNGEMIALPCVCVWPSMRAHLAYGHAMIAVIERVGDTFSVTIHNGGDEIHYHYSKRLDGMETIYQTALRIDSVELPNLLNFIDGLGKLHVVRFKNSTNKLYDKLIPALKGKIAPASADPRLWAKGQTGGSCSGYSVRCLIKSILSETEYRQFKARFFSLMVKNLHQGTKSHRFWEQTSYHHLILKMLKLKLQGLPKKYIDKDTRELLKKSDDLQPSYGGRTVEKLLITDYTKYSHKIIAFNGVNPKIGKLIKSLQNHIKIQDTEKHLKRKRYYKKQDKKAQNIINELTLKINRLYLRLDRKAFTEIEQRELDSSLAELLKAKRNVVMDFNHINSFSEAVERFQKAAIPHYKKHHANLFVSPLLEAVDLIKQKKIKQAKELLSTVYKDVLAYPDKLDSKELSELCCILDDFSEIYRTHFPQTAEAFECLAAFELLFVKLKEKRKSPTIDIFPTNSLEPLYELFQWHLAHVIKGSVWEEDMRAEYEKHHEKTKALHASTPNASAKTIHF